MSVMPDTTYWVRLTDDETKVMVWEGKLTSGQDELYLGDDHSSYKVEMKQVISGITNFVYLAKK